MTAKEYLQKWIDENRDEFERIAKYIWENPEPAMQEHKSAAALCGVLEKYGFSVTRNVADMPTAFLAEWSNSEGPAIGFSAEYDALDGLSQKAQPQREATESQTTYGHGCGHNILGTAAILTAAALKTCAEEKGLRLKIKVFGTPAEEVCVGKPFMGRAGLFSGLDAILDWHPYYYNKCGYEMYSAYFNVKYHFKGQSAHGNAPWQGRSALDGALLAGHGIEMLREHILPGPEDSPNTINYTYPDVGGSSPGVIPETATLWVIGRGKNTDIITDIMKRVEDCAKAGALASGTTMKREFITATHEKITNLTLASLMNENFKEIGVPSYSPEEQAFIKELQQCAEMDATGISSELQPFSGGVTPVTDATEYSWNAPYTSAFVCAAPNNKWWHNWTITACMGTSIAGKAMVTAAKLLGSTAVDLVENPDVLEQAQKEFQERMNGAIYHSLLPDDLKPPVTLNQSTEKK